VSDTALSKIIIPHTDEAINDLRKMHNGPHGLYSAPSTVSIFGDCAARTGKSGCDRAQQEDRVVPPAQSSNILTVLFVR
jgi:hypothetical protein